MRTQKQIEAQQRNFTIMRIRGAYDLAKLSGKFPQSLREEYEECIEKMLDCLGAERQSARWERWRQELTQ